MLFLFIIPVISNSQNQKPRDPRTSSLLPEGRTYLVNYFSFDTLKHANAVPGTDEILFLNRKFFTLNLNRDNKLTPDIYYASLDSSDSSGRIKFVAFSKDASGNPDIFWQGNITGNTIQGTLHWFRYNTTWMFSGTLKNQGKAQ